MSDISLENQPGKWRLRRAIAKNEMWNIVRHPFYLVSMFIPVGMALVFSLVMNAQQEDKVFTILVYDQGESALVTGLVDIEEAEWQIVGSETAVIEAVEAGDATGGIIIPPEFDTAVANGNPPEIIAYVNHEARTTNIVKFKQGLINQIWQLAYEAPPATVQWQDINLGIPSFPDFSVEMYITIMFVMLGATLIVMGLLSQMIVEARENGIVSMLLASPVEANDWLFGLSAVVIICTMISSVILLFLHDGSIGNWGLTLLTILILTIVLNGLGLLLGLVFNTSAECKTYTAVISLLLIIPSWFLLIPLQKIPVFARLFLQLTPTYYFSRILIESLNGTATIMSVAPHLLALLLFGVLFYGILHWQLQKRPLQ